MTATSEHRADKPKLSLQCDMPGALGLVFVVCDHAAVWTCRNVEVEVPPEVFLTRLVVRVEPCSPQSCNKPLRKVITETAVVDEVLTHVGRVERGALE